MLSAFLLFLRGRFAVCVWWARCRRATRSHSSLFVSREPLPRVLHKTRLEARLFGFEAKKRRRQRRNVGKLSLS